MAISIYMHGVVSIFPNDTRDVDSYDGEIPELKNIGLHYDGEVDLDKRFENTEIYSALFIIIIALSATNVVLQDIRRLVDKLFSLCIKKKDIIKKKTETWEEFS